MAKRKRPALGRRAMSMYRRILANQGDWYLDHEFVWRRHWGSFGSGMESNAWAAYYFAKRWQGRDIDLARLQNIVIRHGTAKCAILFAAGVREASVRKLQYAVIRRGDCKALREFAKLPGADPALLNGLADVREVFEM